MCKTKIHAISGSAPVGISEAIVWERETLVVKGLLVGTPATPKTTWGGGMRRLPSPGPGAKGGNDWVNGSAERAVAELDNPLFWLERTKSFVGRPG